MSLKMEVTTYALGDYNPYGGVWVGDIVKRLRTFLDADIGIGVKDGPVIGPVRVVRELRTFNACGEGSLALSLVEVEEIKGKEVAK